MKQTCVTCRHEFDNNDITQAPECVPCKKWKSLVRELKDMYYLGYTFDEAMDLMSEVINRPRMEEIWNEWSFWE